MRISLAARFTVFAITVGILLVLPACEDIPLRARTSLLGLSRTELTMCAGPAMSVETIDARNSIAFYRHEPGNSGLSLTLPVLGGISISSKQSCTAMFRMIDGRVVEVRYAGPTRSSFASPDGVCEPIVLHCVHEPEHIPEPSPTGLCMTEITAVRPGGDPP